MLQPILLIIIPRLELLAEIVLVVGDLEVADRGDASGVVGGCGGAAQALAQDPVAGAEALGVVGLGEDCALDLGGRG